MVSTMLITLDEYKDLFGRGYSFWFRDCVVRYNDLFVFVLEPSYTDEQVEEEERNGWDSSLRPKGWMMLDLSRETGKQWNGHYLFNWQHTVIGAAQKPLNQAVMIESTSTYPSMDHKGYVVGSGPAHEDHLFHSYGNEQPTEGNFLRGALTRLKSLDGWLYGCGGRRSLGKRLDRARWQSFSEDIPIDPTEHRNDIGFKDFDGWGENDIYAVGGMGDVWHFNGQDWRQIPFPSNMMLSAVCCAGDGQVYIAAYNGIFRGRDNHWQKIGETPTDLLIKDMVWYEDKVWFTNDYGLWTIDNGRVSRADVPSDVSACAGNLSVGDGVLLLCGLYGAVFRQDGEWHTIIHFGVMERLLELEQSELKDQEP